MFLIQRIPFPAGCDLATLWQGRTGICSQQAGNLIQGTEYSLMNVVF